MNEEFTTDQNDEIFPCKSSHDDLLLQNKSKSAKNAARLILNSLNELEEKNLDKINFLQNDLPIIWDRMDEEQICNILLSILYYKIEIFDETRSELLEQIDRILDVLKNSQRVYPKNFIALLVRFCGDFDTEVQEKAILCFGKVIDNSSFIFFSNFLLQAIAKLSKNLSEEHRISASSIVLYAATKSLTMRKEVLFRRIFNMYHTLLVDKSILVRRMAIKLLPQYFEKSHIYSVGQKFLTDDILNSIFDIIHMNSNDKMMPESIRIVAIRAIFCFILYFQDSRKTEKALHTINSLFDDKSLGIKYLIIEFIELIYDQKIKSKILDDNYIIALVNKVLNDENESMRCSMITSLGRIIKKYKLGMEVLSMIDIQLIQKETEKNSNKIMKGSLIDFLVNTFEVPSITKKFQTAQIFENFIRDPDDEIKMKALEMIPSLFTLSDICDVKSLLNDVLSMTQSPNWRIRLISHEKLFSCFRLLRNDDIIIANEIWKRITDGFYDRVWLVRDNLGNLVKEFCKNEGFFNIRNRLVSLFKLMLTSKRYSIRIDVIHHNLKILDFVELSYLHYNLVWILERLICDEVPNVRLNCVVLLRSIQLKSCEIPVQPRLQDKFSEMLKNLSQDPDDDTRKLVALSDNGFSKSSYLQYIQELSPDS